MYGVVLIGVLAVAGGVIAFVGDYLGTKIGKKRLSIFGLRPRHTSMIITVLTGVAITVLTFGVMAAVSENVRTALFGMEQLNKNMAKTQEDLMAASKELLAAREEKQKTTAALAQAKKDVENMQKEQEKLREESERLAEGNRQLETEKEMLLAQNNELSSANANLAARNDGLSAQNATLAAKNNSLAEQNDNLGAANADLTKDNAELTERAQRLRDGLVAVREGSIVYRAGEVIASGVVTGNRAPNEVSEDLAKLVEAADNDVKMREGEDGAVWIYPPEYESAIAKIAESGKNKLVRIAAAGNLVKGEPVRTSILLFDNDVIYAKNEFVISQTYDVHNLTVDEAENLIMDFLRDANGAAVNKGVLRDPIRGSVGVMDGAQFYELVDALRPLSGKVVISAFARDDTDAAGPMRLNIKIEQEDM